METGLKARNSKDGLQTYMLIKQLLRVNDKVTSLHELLNKQDHNKESYKSLQYYAREKAILLKWLKETLDKAEVIEV